MFSEVDHHKKEPIEHALHTTSIAILALFVAEVLQLIHYIKYSASKLPV